MPENTKILIADSQYLVVSSLKRLIESELGFIVCGVADSRNSVTEMIKSQVPALLITDVNMIDYNGFDDITAIKNECGSNLSVLALVNQLSGREIYQLIRSGIKNITLKNATREELVFSIEMALKKKKHLSDEILDIIAEMNLPGEPGQEHSGLTPAEEEVIRMVAGGLTTKEIASRKNISIHTVMTHRKNIFRKLDINNISDLTRYAIRTGIIDHDIDFNI